MIIDETQPMPLLAKAFIFTYMGAVGMKEFVFGLESSNPFIDILQLILVVVFVMFFSYGVICFIQDIKKGSIYYVITKIREFLNV